MKIKFNYILATLVTGIIVNGCDQEMTPAADSTKPAVSAPIDANTDSENQNRTGNATPERRAGIPQTQFNVGNKSYLFDVSDHSLEELQALLARADEITQMPSDDYGDLEIVMILHGPDIDWFKQKNYEKNKSLVDLAAKLDANEIIDLKVCETTMSSLGVEREELPAFIEAVPYAPDEMRRLLREGYINL